MAPPLKLARTRSNSVYYTDFHESPESLIYNKDLNYMLKKTGKSKEIQPSKSLCYSMHRPSLKNYLLVTKLERNSLIEQVRFAGLNWCY